MKISNTKQAMDLLHSIGANSVGLCYHEDSSISDQAQKINKDAYDVFKFLMEKESLENDPRRN